MTKSLGDYNIERSSSSDVKNIKWTKKETTEKTPKIRKKKAIPPTNIIPSKKTKSKPSTKKVFKVDDNSDTEKPKTKTGKRFQKSSATNCKIERSYKRKAR